MKKQLLSLSLLLNSMSFVYADKPLEYYVELVKLCKEPHQSLLTRIRCLGKKNDWNSSDDIPRDLIDEVYSLKYEKNIKEIEAFMEIASLDQFEEIRFYNWISNDINLVNMFLNRLKGMRMSDSSIRHRILPVILYSYMNNLNNQEMYYLLLSQLFKKIVDDDGVWIFIDASYFKKALSLQDNDAIVRWLFQEKLIKEYRPTAYWP